MLYSCTHMATVGFKGLTDASYYHISAKPVTLFTISATLHLNSRDVKYSRPMWPRGQNYQPRSHSIGLVLVLMQCWPCSHEGCPCGLVVSHRNHVIYVTFFTDRKLLLAL